MATILHISLFNTFSSLFAFLFIFVLVFAVLEMRNFFKNSGLHALIALFVAALVGTSSNILPIISWMTPWFVMLLVFFVFLVLILSFIGISEKGIISGLGGESGITVAMMILLAIFFVAALGHVYGQQTLELTTGGQGNATMTGSTGVQTVQSSFTKNVATVFFHPKVLGLILMMLVAAFTIRLMANPT